MITKDNNLKVMELFFKHPYTKSHIREIARKVKLSTTGVIKIIERLKKEKLLLSHKTGIIEEVSPNLNGRFYMLKKVYNIYSLADSGFVDYLKKYYEHPKAIIVFGSYAYGTDTEKSDIDIAIIGNKKDPPNLSNYEKIFARKINIYTINIDKSTKEFINSIANGIVLDGFVEFV
ncbi:nucleotidyltransferase domain-containing protein [Candidatus Woesearchaeota archaeon]|nr:nucleotidyltransferase domain-containing protein [Candidatus Woesearchaeota archaeon]